MVGATTGALAHAAPGAAPAAPAAAKAAAVPVALAPQSFKGKRSAGVWTLTAPAATAPIPTWGLVLCADAAAAPAVAASGAAAPAPLARAAAGAEEPAASSAGVIGYVKDKRAADKELAKEAFLNAVEYFKGLSALNKEKVQGECDGEERGGQEPGERGRGASC